MLKLQLILRSNDWAAEQSLQLIVRPPSTVNGKYHCKAPQTATSCRAPLKTGATVQLL